MRHWCLGSSFNLTLRLAEICSFIIVWSLYRSGEQCMKAQAAHAQWTGMQGEEALPKTASQGHAKD